MNYYLVAQPSLYKPLYIEASCDEEARNVYIALNSINKLYQIRNTYVRVYGVALSDTLNPRNTVSRIDFCTRPEGLRKKPRYRGLTSYVDAQYYHISERQWEYIESICDILDITFTGITRIDAAKFIDDHAEELMLEQANPASYYND